MAKDLFLDLFSHPAMLDPPSFSPAKACLTPLFENHYITFALPQHYRAITMH